MNGGTADEAAQLSRSKPIIMSGIVATILGWIFGVREAAKSLLQPRHPVSTENTAESATAEATAAQAGTDGIDIKLTVTKSFTTAPMTDVDVGGIAQTVPDQQEIERRRVLVRALFNDFWNGADNKPAAFAERLDQAEDYLNARLMAHGALWRLDANTRAMLGLPPRSSSPD